jgi:hypothetical protein
LRSWIVFPLWFLAHQCWLLVLAGAATDEGSDLDAGADSSMVAPLFLLLGKGKEEYEGEVDDSNSMSSSPVGSSVVNKLVSQSS